MTDVTNTLALIMDVMMTKFDLEDIVVMEHVCAVTALSPKLADLLRVIVAHYELDEDHVRMAKYAEEALDFCAECIEKTKKRTSEKNGIPLDLLNRSAVIYSVHDSVIVSASIREKIKQWRLAFVLAICESKLSENSKVFQLYSVFSNVFDGLPEMTTDDIIESLNDHADEIQAWLDIEFAEEAEECNADADCDELDDFFTIIAKLKLMVEELKKIR